MLWLLQVYPLKVAKNENHCMVVKRKSSQNCGIRTHCMIVTTKSSQSCRIWMPLYVSYKKSVSKVAEYEYNCRVIKRKSPQSSRIWIPLYGKYKEILSKLRDMNTIVSSLKEIASKLWDKNTIVWYLQGKRLKVAQYKYHRMLITRKSSQSCGIWMPLYGIYKEIV